MPDAVMMSGLFFHAEKAEWPAVLIRPCAQPLRSPGRNLFAPVWMETQILLDFCRELRFYYLRNEFYQINPPLFPASLSPSLQLKT
jgi:hypothetical protein